MDLFENDGDTSRYDRIVDGIIPYITGQVVYHKTAFAEQIMKQGFRTSEGMIWFTDSDNIALETSEQGPHDIIAVKLRIENPYYEQPTDSDWPDQEMVNRLIEQGYDAIIGPSNAGHTDYIVFSNDQIEIVGVEKQADNDRRYDR